RSIWRMHMFGSGTRLSELSPLQRQGVLIAATFAALVIGRTLSWPLWATAVSLALPWLPLFIQWTMRSYRTQPWLGFFFLLTAFQLSHLGEHIVQMVQIHVLGLQGVDARGVFGVFDIEWVHFIWNASVLLGALVLLPHNPG